MEITSSLIPTASFHPSADLDAFASFEVEPPLLLTVQVVGIGLDVVGAVVDLGEHEPWRHG